MLTSLRPYFSLSAAQTKPAVRFNGQSNSMGNTSAGKIRFSGIDDVDRLHIRNYPQLTQAEKRSMKEDRVVKKDPKTIEARRVFELDRQLHSALDSWGRDRAAQIQEIFSQFAFRKPYHELEWGERRQVLLACKQIAKDYETPPGRNNLNVKPIGDYGFYMLPHQSRVILSVQHKNDGTALEQFKEWALEKEPQASEGAIQTQFTKMQRAINRGDSIHIEKFSPSLLDTTYEAAVVKAVHEQKDDKALQHFASWVKVSNPNADSEAIKAQFERMKKAINRGDSIRIGRYAVTVQSP